MANTIQYITNEAGERVGVMLDIEMYEQLTHPLADDPECLLNVSESELQAFANIELALNTQPILDTLLNKNKEGQLSDDETGTLDQLLDQVDQLTVLKARAKYTLHRLQEVEVTL